MDGDLFQVLFVLVILVASVFDTIARTKRKQGRRPDGEASSEAESEERARQRQEALERRRQAIEKRRARGAGTATAERSPPTKAAEPRQAAKPPRETADSMVPADLWAVLTGQPAPPTHRTPPTYGDSTDVEPWDESGIEGESAEIAIERESVQRAPAETIPAHRTRVERIPIETVLVESLPVEPIPGGRAGRGVRFVEGGHAAPVRPLVASLGPRRASRRRRHGRLLAGGGPDELRKAVVLTEVLGQPVALRRSGHPWEER